MRLLLLSLFLTFYMSCSSSGDPSKSEGKQPPEKAYQLVNAFPELSFTRPVDLQQAGDNSNRLFVVEQKGVISVFPNEAATNNKTVFLDIQDLVDNAGNEEGLLGLAFHPDYKTNGYLYVNYTASNPSRTVIARYQVSDQNPNQADKSTAQVILSFEQPYGNHNGGNIAFGPDDGYLYIGAGDGGSGGDPKGNGQNRSTLLGSILRIDVDHQENGNQYAIPSDNPFAGNSEGYREEIYAYGLRNPWRFSFDAETNRLWAGDVGQNTYEEVDIIDKGGNYGWNVMEGKHCFKPSDGCSQSGLELPIWDYNHDKGDVSITGGFVYRGSSLKNLTGLYIYADYGSGRIWTLDSSDLTNPVNNELLRADFSISSFGVDQQHELYICGFDGNIYRLEKS